MVRARDRRLARLRDAPAPAVHGVASLVRRHRRLPGARDRLGSPRRSGGGFRARGRDRRPRARRAARAPAPHGDSEPRARRPRRDLDRRSVRDRRCGRDRLRALDRPARPGRRLPRSRLQPRAPRRTVPLGPLVRSRVGWVSRRLWICGGRRRPERRSAARGCVRRSPLARAARALEPRALRPPPSCGRRRGARAR